MKCDRTITTLGLATMLVAALMLLSSPGATAAASTDAVLADQVAQLAQSSSDIKVGVDNFFTRIDDLESTINGNVKNMTGFLQGIQASMQSLQQTLAGQASAIRRLEARAVFDMSEEFRGKNYLVSRSEEAFNIQNADASCEAFGGYLVEVDDQPEFDFLVKFLESVGGAHYFATATNDIEEEGKFVFYHSKKPVTFNIWENGEPNNSHGGENCAGINWHKDGMNDIQCDVKVKYVCEVSF